MHRVELIESNENFADVLKWDNVPEKLFEGIPDDLNAPSVDIEQKSLALEKGDEVLPVLNLENDSEPTEDLVDSDELEPLQQIKGPSALSEAPLLVDFDMNEYGRLKVLCSKQLNQMQRLKLLSLAEIKTKFKDALKSYSKFYSKHVAEKNIAAKIDKLPPHLKAKINMVPPRFKILFTSHNHEILLAILNQAIDNFKASKRKNEFVIRDPRFSIPKNPTSQLTLDIKNLGLLRKACCTILLNRLKLTSFTVKDIRNVKGKLVEAIISGINVPHVLVKYFDTYFQPDVKDTILKVIERYQPSKKFINSVTRSVKSDNPANQELESASDLVEDYALEQNIEVTAIVENVSDAEVVLTIPNFSEENFEQELSLVNSELTSSDFDLTDTEKKELEKSSELSDLDVMSIDSSKPDVTSSDSSSVDATPKEVSILAPLLPPIKSNIRSYLVFDPSDNEEDGLEQNSESLLFFNPSDEENDENSWEIEIAERSKHVPLRQVGCRTPPLHFTLFQPVRKEAEVNESNATQLALKANATLTEGSTNNCEIVPPRSI